MSKSNIIVRVRYKKDKNKQKLVGGWCKYSSKEHGADNTTLRTEENSTIEIEKELGIFDDSEEVEEHFIWNKNGDINKRDIIKDLPKDKSGRMWNLVISFPPKFAYDNNLKTKYDYYLLSKRVIPRLILDNDMDLTNTKWYSVLHRDTDNPHLHICIFEDKDRRKKDTLDKDSIKKLKSNIASYLVDNSKFYKNEDYNLLGLNYKIRKENLTKIEKSLFFTSKFRRELNKDLLSLYSKLPKKGRLQYNSKNLYYCRSDIDKIIEKILYHDTIKYDFEKYYHTLEEIEKKQKKMYGNSKNNHYIDNKMKRLYSKIGNDILQNFKVYNSKSFLDYQKEFLKLNIMDMKFTSKNIKTKSTVLKHGAELYKLGRLAELSESDMKKLLNNWAKRSNIDIDINTLYSAVSNNDDDISVSDFYKTLSHLGYRKERYDNLRSKSFYKSLRFKQFIKSANYYLIVENRKEEEFLREVIEKELQGKDL